MNIKDRVARLENSMGTRRGLELMSDRELVRIICGDSDASLTDEELLEIISEGKERLT